MSFVVTARKYRPQSFADVVGQEHITTTLKNAIRNGRVAHAYLFTGPRGVGKTTTARILAKSLNCENPVDAEPCNACDMCNAIQTTQMLDIIEIDAASNRGIDEIRMLRESVKYAPSRGKYKVYIIDEVHMLTRDSFNAFLKTLEEPPSHTVFIFATTDVQKVPLTIISRCQRYDFRRIKLDVIKTLLAEIAAKEGISADDRSLTLIARKSDGGLRDAESFFDQTAAFCNGDIRYETVVSLLSVIDDEVFFRLTDAILAKEYSAAFTITRQIYDNGWGFIDFFEGLTAHFRNLMTYLVTGSSALIETADYFKGLYANYQGKFTEQDILRVLQFLTRTMQELRFSQNYKLKTEVALCQVIGFETGASLSQAIEAMKGFTQLPTSAPVTAVNLNAQQQPKAFGFSPVMPADAPAPVVREPSPSAPVQPAKPQSSAALNISAITTAWGEFTGAIAAEKRLIMGSFIPALKPVELNADTLLLRHHDPDAVLIFEQHEDYIRAKIQQFFGKKLNIAYQVEGSSAPEQHSPAAPRTAAQESKRTSVSYDPDDPYAKLIKEELGGTPIG